MENNKLDIVINEDNCDQIMGHMTVVNRIYDLDCMALNPRINEITRGGYDLEIYKITVANNEVFALYFEDGYGGDIEDFNDRTEFYSTEAEAMAALGNEYNDWLTRF